MKPTIGRIVHFVIPKDIPQGEGQPDKTVAGDERAAMIVRTWGGNCVNLHVFSDGGNDHNTVLAGGGWFTSVSQDEETKGPRTWHWPEEREELPKPTKPAPIVEPKKEDPAPAADQQPEPKQEDPSPAVDVPVHD